MESTNRQSGESDETLEVSGIGRTVQQQVLMTLCPITG